jgi:hypothetical protein
MEPQKFTTENAEKKNFRFFGKLSEFSRELKDVIKKLILMRTQRWEGSDFLETSLYLNLFSVFSVVNVWQ